MTQKMPIMHLKKKKENPPPYNYQTYFASPEDLTIFQVKQ